MLSEFTFGGFFATVSRIGWLPLGKMQMLDMHNFSAHYSMHSLVQSTDQEGSFVALSRAYFVDI